MVFRTPCPRFNGRVGKFIGWPCFGFWFLGLVLLSIPGAGVVRCQERLETLKASYEAAQTLFQQGRDDQAADAFRALLQDADRDRATLIKKKPVQLSVHDREVLRIYTQFLAGGHNFLGLIAARHEQFDEAARQFAEVQTLQPSFPDVDFNLGLALFSSRQFSEALGNLERALQHDPSNTKIKKYTGLTEVEAGQYEKGVTLLTEVAHETADPYVLLALGTALARSNRMEESKQVFEELLKSQPESAETHLLWGQVFAAQLQSQEAEGEFRRAIELDPKVASAHFFIGVLDLKAGKLEEAEREFSAELAGHTGDARARYHLAFAQLAQQKPEQAITLLREVVAEQPRYAEAQYSLGKALLQQEDIAGAIEHLEAATKLDAKKSYSHYQLARAYQRAGRNEEAQKEFKTTHELERAEKSNPAHDREKIP
jgi:tetratricopeptide (TPR) repeat protein